MAVARFIPVLPKINKIKIGTFIVTVYDCNAFSTELRRLLAENTYQKIFILV